MIIREMTQDMDNKIMTRNIGNLTRGLSPCEIDELTSRRQRAYGSLATSLRLVVTLLLMLVLGVNTVCGQTEPVEITYDDNSNGTIEDSEKKLYLIQTNQFESFYMMRRDNNVSTNNLPNEQMLWYFLDAGKVGETQYYYIVNNITNKCIYNYNGNSRGIQLTVLSDLSDTDKEKCKFKLVLDNSNGTVGFYNIDTKATQTYYALNKQNGSVNISNHIRTTNDAYVHDYSSKWKFIRYNGTVSWPDPPFTPSTEENMHFFKIKNKINDSYYVSADNSTPKNVTFASTASDNMVWYFKEVPADKAGSSSSWFKYYYIVNPEAGYQYMYYKGTATNGSNQSNAIVLKEKETENEDRYQFVVVRGARTIKDNKNNDIPDECYTIIPKSLCNVLWASNSLGLNANDVSDGKNMGIINGRGAADNYSHWLFEEVWGDPVVTCDEAGTITITGEDGAAFYYTTDGSTVPTTANTQYNANNKPKVSDFSSGITTIKVRAIAAGKSDSRVITQKIVYLPNQTFASSTYDGTTQTPVVKVGETPISTEEYNISYKKGGADVTECKNAGTYTVTITDRAGGEYIVYGNGTFTIDRKDLTITAGSDSKEYDGTALIKNSYAITNNTSLATGDAIESVTITGGQTVVGSSANVPSAAVIKKGETNVTANYIITYANGTLEVSRRALTITADSDSKEYDGTELTKNSYTITNNTSLASGDKITSVTITGSQTDRGDSYNVPSAAVIKNNNGNGDDVTACYDITYVNGTLSVTGRPITITAGSDSKVYDGTALTKNSYTYDGTLFSGDAIESVAITGSQTIVGSSDNVPSAAVIKNGGTDVTANYTITYVNGTLEVTQKDLTITAKPKTITYGDAPANDGVTYTGFVNNETEAVLGGTLDYDYSYTQYGNVGNTYTITPKGLTSTNYAITFNTGTLTVEQKEVGLTWQNTTLPYNGTVQAPTATATGIVNSDDISVTVTGGKTNIGTGYTATATELTGAKAGNYKLPTANTTTYAITARPVTISGITAEDKVYNGSTTATLDFTNATLTGKVGSEDLTFTATGAFADANVGTGKTVNISGLTLGGADAGNYTLAGSGQQETTTADITAKAVTITAKDASRNYNGSPLTQTEFTATDLEDGDTHTFTVTMTAGSTITNVGSTPNVIATVDGVAVTTGIETAVGNYLVTTVDGTLTINGAPITITIKLDNWTYGNPKSPSVTGNTGNGKVTYSYKKQTEDDTKYKADRPSNAGDYTVRAEVAATSTTAAATVTKDFSILKAPLTIKADAKEKEYLDADPELTYQVTGLVSPDVKEDFVTCVLQRDDGTDVGDYTIRATTAENKMVKANTNYQFGSFVESKLKIKTKVIGEGSTPATGITIYAKKNDNPSSWSVSLYNGTNAFKNSDYSYEVSDEPDADGNYTVTVTAIGNNCSGSATATYTNFTFPTEISGVEKASPYITSDKDIKISSEITPYIVSKVNPAVGTISVSPINYIPKDVPVLLLAKSDVTGLTTSPTNNEEAVSDYTLSSNKLMYSSGGVVPVQNAEAYLYYKGEFVLTLAGNIPQNKFYLYNPNYSGDSGDSGSQAPSRSLYIIKDETTGLLKLVSDKAAEDENDKWYSLDGRRLNGMPAKKGVYIKNGKKKVVK